MSVLKSIVCSVTLSSLDGNQKPLTDTFVAGKNLVSVSGQNGEGDRSNACSVTISDPGLKIAAKYRGRSLAIGGIRVPVNLLEKPEETKGAATGGSVPDINGSPKGDDLARAIVAYCRSVGVTDTGQIAYILATAQHESGMGQYQEEIASGSAYEGRGDLGNTQPGDGVRFKGRGYVQITGRTNYSRWGQFLGIDAIANPALLSQPKYAIATLVLGMTGKNGAPNFTGSTVGQYISGSNRDFIGARAVVNGSDRASLIAGYAQTWLGRIASLGAGGGTAPAAKPASPPATSQPEQFAPAGLVKPGSQDPIDDAKKALQAQQPKDPIPPDCTEITITFTDHTGAIVSFAFWMTGEATTNKQLERTTFQGRGLRFLIGTARNRATYKNISLRQLTERIGDRIGADVTIPNKPASEKINTKITQNGETDYQFLLRLANSVGYTIKEVKGKDGAPPALSLVEAKSGAVLKADRSWISSLSTSDEASIDRVLLESISDVLKTTEQNDLKALPPISSLADGEAIGEGYVTALEIPYPTIAQLAIQPGTILEIQTDLAPSPIARDYRVKSVRWAWKGAIDATIELYIPVNVKPKNKADTTAEPGQESAGFQSLTPTAGTGSQYSLPGMTGKYDNRTPVIQGGRITWGDVTKNGQRIPSSAEITQNIVRMASEFQRVVEPILAGKKFVITSFFRPEPYNSAAGGAVGSYHLTGRAIDFYSDEMPGQSLHTALDSAWNGGLGRYSDARVHIDIGSRSRFDGG